MEFHKSRRELYEVLREKSGEGRNNQIKHLFQFLLKSINIDSISEDCVKKIRVDVSRFCSKIFNKLEKCRRIEDVFLKNNFSWLEKDEVFLVPISSTTTHSEKQRGRPNVSFEDSSDRSKKRKTEELRRENSSKELAFATKVHLKEQGEGKASELVNEAVLTTPTRAEKILRIWKSSKSQLQVKPYDENEAISLIIEGNLSQRQYKLIRTQAKERHANIYPSYNRILKSKERCYPGKESMVFSESLAEVQLQSLLDHTTWRIVELQDPVLVTLNNLQPDKFVLLSKWGCDGSSGQSEYKQRFSDQNLSDSHVFLSSLVPIQLYYTIEGEKIIIWQNPRPSSPRYCRPIRMQWKKETKALSIDEKMYVENQVLSLQPTVATTSAGQDIRITHQLHMTMIDGKICSAITDTPSSQTCYVCGATPKSMNNIDDAVKRTSDTSTFQFGLSTLHAWIRFLECVLHLSYRLDVKKWQVRDAEHKKLFLDRKTKVQAQIREQMGLLVDYPRAGGSGTSNDGNTARRFFKNPSLAASLTGVDENLIRRFATVLQALSCGYDVSEEDFGNYALETAKLFVDLYPWYYMPTSVHKILLHGSSIISAALLPIGQMSEEAQEARNKDIKTFRLQHARKFSRAATNEDIFRRLLLSSDPVISSIRQLPRKTSTSLSAEVIGLLKSALPPLEVQGSNTENSDESDCDGTDSSESEY